MEITHMLPDKWGTDSYQGKDLTILPFLLDLYKIDNKLIMTTLILDVIKESSDITNEEVNKRVKRTKHG